MSFYWTALGVLTFSELTGLGRGYTDRFLNAAIPVVESAVLSIRPASVRGEGDLVHFLRDFRQSRQYVPGKSPSWYWPRPGIDGERGFLQIKKSPEQIIDGKKGARNPKYAGFTEAFKP